jgi:hypothetical protein
MKVEIIISEINGWVYTGIGRLHYINGVLSRLDGPAIARDDGYNYWYIGGKYIECKTQEEFEQIMKLKTFW